MTQIKNQILIQSQPFVTANAPPGGGGGRYGSRKDHPPETAGVHTLQATASFMHTTDKKLKINKINVNLKNSKIMKKLFFSFVMLVTLVIVAGSAKAQLNTTVIPGGTYQYTLKGITVNTAGTATIDFEGDAAEQISITSGFSGTSSPYIAPANNSYDAVFTVHYSTSASIGDANLVVKIKDGSQNGCTNTITLKVTVLAAPTIDLAINSDATAPYCQTANNTTDNTAASKDQNNTIKFTVAPTFSNTDNATTHTTFKYGYTIKLPNPGSALGTTATGGAFKVMRGTEDVTSAIISGSGLVRSELDVTQTGATPSEEYTVTFYTTTGIAAQDLEGTVSAVSVKENRTGGDTYNETAIENNSHAVKINAIPSIGKFE